MALNLKGEKKNRKARKNARTQTVISAYLFFWIWNAIAIHADQVPQSWIRWKQFRGFLTGVQLIISLGITSPLPRRNSATVATRFKTIGTLTKFRTQQSSKTWLTRFLRHLGNVCQRLVNFGMDFSPGIRRHREARKIEIRLITIFYTIKTKTKAGCAVFTVSFRMANLWHRIIALPFSIRSRSAISKKIHGLIIYIEVWQLRFIMLLFWFKLCCWFRQTIITKYSLLLRTVVVAFVSIADVPFWARINVMASNVTVIIAFIRLIIYESIFIFCFILKIAFSFFLFSFIVFIPFVKLIIRIVCKK